MMRRRPGPRLLVAAASVLALTAVLGAGQQDPATAARAGADNPPGSPRLGPERAPVTIVFFADFADPECGAATVVLKALLAGDPDRIALVFRHRPAPGRPDRLPAHHAAVAAGEQDRFWEMFELLMANQKTHAPADLGAMAAQLELDLSRFAADGNDPKTLARVAADMDDAAAHKVTATPAFVINSRTVIGRKTLGELRDLVAEALAAPAPPRRR